MGGRDYQLNTSAASTPKLSRNPQSHWMKGGKKTQEHALKNVLLSGLATKPTVT